MKWGKKDATNVHVDLIELNKLMEKNASAETYPMEMRMCSRENRVKANGKTPA